MVLHSFFIVNKSGGLIFDRCVATPTGEPSTPPPAHLLLLVYPKSNALGIHLRVGLIFDERARPTGPPPSTRRELTPGARLGGNDKLLLASTFHSLHAISKQLAPVPGGGGISQVRGRRVG